MKSLTENYYTVFHASAIFQVIVGVSCYSKNEFIYDKNVPSAIVQLFCNWLKYGIESQNIKIAGVQ